jgi:hypothetical protein
MAVELLFRSPPSEDFLEEYAFQRLAEEEVAPLEEHPLERPSWRRRWRKSMNTGS